MRKIFRVVLAIVVAGLSASCADNVEKLASERFGNALKAFDEGQFAQARQEIDSIRILYPTATDTRRKALGLMQKIEIIEQTRTIAYEDSIIAVSSARLEEMLPSFTLEKDTQYQDIGNWVIPSLQPENNLTRSYLRAQVDEKGRLTLISTYRGAQYIHHNSFRVSVGESYFDTPAIDNVYEYRDLDLCYEKCNVQESREGGVAAFIAANRNSRNMVLTLNGQSRSVKVQMTASDVSSIARLYDLSQLMLFVNEHKAIRQEAERRINFVRSRIDAAADSI